MKNEKQTTKESELLVQYFLLISLVFLGVILGWIVADSSNREQNNQLQPPQKLTYEKCGEYQTIKLCDVSSSSFKDITEFREGLPNGWLPNLECVFKTEKNIRIYPIAYEKVCTKPLLCEKKIIYEEEWVPVSNFDVLNGSSWTSFTKVPLSKEVEVCEEVKK